MIRIRLSIVAFASRERNFIFEAVCSCATHVEKTDRTRPIGKSDDRLVYTRTPHYQASLKPTLANPGKHSLNPKNARYPSESRAGHVMWVIVWRFAETEWIGEGAPD